MLFFRMSFEALQQDLTQRRSELVTILDFILPIRPLEPPSATPLQFTIASLPLANSSFSSTADDDQISSAFGHVVLLVALLAAYHGVSSHYPLKPCGSRSLISDPISAAVRGLRTFPLYMRGMDRYRFDYAVFLLNKDIEQLLGARRPNPLAVLDLRHTLPNLYNFILTATIKGYVFFSRRCHPSLNFEKPDDAHEQIGTRRAGTIFDHVVR